MNVLHPEVEHADLWVRELEAGGKKPASVGMLLAGAHALYPALCWTKATKVGVLTVQHGKGGKVRRVLLADSLVADLQELGPQEVEWAVIGRTPEAARMRLRTLCRKVQVPYLGLHALRHAAGTRLIRAGFQLQDVAENLGRSDVQTARSYGKWADDRLREHLQRQ